MNTVTSSSDDPMLCHYMTTICWAHKGVEAPKIPLRVTDQDSAATLDSRKCQHVGEAGAGRRNHRGRSSWPVSMATPDATQPPWHRWLHTGGSVRSRCWYWWDGTAPRSRPTWQEGLRGGAPWKTRTHHQSTTIFLIGLPDPCHEKDITLFCVVK